MDNKEYDRILSKLKKDENLFNGFIKIIYPTCDAQLKSVQKHSKAFKSANDINAITGPIVVKQIDDVLNKKRPYGHHGRKLPKLVRKYGDLIPEDAKNKILTLVCTPMDNFYGYAKKDLLMTTVHWINTEEMAIRVIQNHHRLLSIGTLENLLSKIANGIEHDSLAEFRNSSLPFVAQQLQALDTSNEDDRHRIINAIAKSPALLNYFNISLNITLSDLKKLPPARRFDFLQYYFEPIFGRYNAHYKNWYPRTINREHFQKAKTHKRYFKLSMDKLSRDEVKHLLFSVSIRKNEEVAAWYDRYDTYLKKL